MSNININQLPLAIGLSGSEYFPLTQGGVTKRASVALLATQPGTGLTGTDGYFLTGQGDGVSPVIIGGNDWAAAWAVDGSGRFISAPSPGGELQREMALRFGINLVIYALTGNYKTDVVHAPALLQRLGNERR